jgi:hypothetical protein
MATNNLPNISFDVTDQEEDLDFYVGPDPTRGAYRAKVGALTFQEKNSKGDPMLTLRAVITDGQYSGWAGWDRITLTEASKWKLAQLIRALGLPDKINLRKLMQEANKGKALGILVGPDTDAQGNPTVGVKRLFPISKLDDDAEYSGDDDANVDPDSTDDADVEEGTDDDNAEDGSDDDDGDGDIWTREELEELSPEDLRAVAAGKGITYNKRTKDEALVDSILESQGGEPDDGDDDGDDDADGDGSGDDDSVYTEEELKALDPSDLKEVAETLGVESPSGKKLLLIKQILKAQEAPF